MPLLLSLCFLPLHGQIQWEKTVSTVQTGILNTSCIPDHDGGFFAVWQDERGGRTAVLAQHLDRRGNALWNPAGSAVCTASSGQSLPSLCEDGSGGILVAWQDDRNANLDIFMQRIRQDGSPAWNPGGVVLCDTVEDQSVPRLLWNGADGAVAVWHDKRHDGIGNLYAQKLSPDGTVQWKSNGAAVTRLFSGNRAGHQICMADRGDVYVAWRDDRTDNSNIFIQKLSGDGAAQWTERGKAVAFGESPQISPCLACSGTDVLVFWQEKRWLDTDIFAQKMDSDGNALWDADGIPVNSSAGDQTNPAILVNQDGWIFAAWTDGRNGDSDIFLQYLNPLGYFNWAESGIAAVLETGEQYNATLAPDGSGGVLVQWCDRRNGTETQVYAQRLTAEGVPQWASNGLAVSQSGGNHSENQMISDGCGGAFSIWTDQSAPALREGLLNDAIRFSYPNRRSFLPIDTPVELRWTQRINLPEISSFQIRCAMNPDDPFSLRVAENIPVPSSLWIWQVPNTAASQAVLRLDAVDGYGNTAYAFLSEPFGIDATGPSAFRLIQPANGTETHPRPEFKWENASDLESGISHYRLMIDNALFMDSIPEPFFQPSIAQKLPAGLHSWTAFAVNRAGMAAPASQTWSVRISTDETGPQVFHLLEPPHGFWTDGQNISLKWEPAQDAESGIWKYALYLNGQLVVPDIPAVQTSYAVTLPTGDYTWRIRAVDRVGNSRDSEESRVFHVDQDPPYSFNLLLPADGSWTRVDRPVFQWTTSGDAGCGLNHYELVINDALILESIAPESLRVSLPQGSRLADGIHSWSILAVDLLGNSRRAEQTFRIRIDTQPPAEPVRLEPARDSYTGTPTPNFRWKRSTDAGIGLSHYELMVDGQTIRTVLDTLSSPAQALQPGRHSWALVAVDLLGNSRQTSAFFFTADWNPPQPFELLAPEANTLIRRNRPLFAWQRAQDESGIFHYELSLDGTLHPLTGSDTSHVPVQFLFNGPHVWHVQAVDSAGNRRMSESWRFEVLVGSPQIHSAARDTAREDLPYAYTAEASDPDGNELSFAFCRYASWLSQDGHILSGTPGTAGADSFWVFANNGTFQDSLKVRLIILETNDSPVILSRDTVTVVAGQAMAYQAEVEDEDGPNLFVWFENIPPWLTVSGTRLTGIPPENADGSAFLLIASDGLASDTLRVILRVLKGNPGPAFDIRFPTLTVPAHETLRWQFSLDDQASDPGFPDSVLVWAYSVFPPISGVDVDINERGRTATLQVLNMTQDVRIVFTVANPLGQSASDTLRLIVATSGHETGGRLPETTEILLPYPNPFNPTLDFGVDLSAGNEVRIDVYDANGRHITRIWNGPLKAGRHRFHWQAGDCPAGIYLYDVRTATPAVRRSGKALLLK
ncbi:hypothetical protein JW906_04350 [bacterium]|nr:hypothetical protein [bacterium]